MNTIEIRTTQNVVIEYELASLRDRIIAYVLDIIIFLIAYYFVFVLLLSSLLSRLTHSDLWLSVFFGFLPIAGWLLYHLLFELFNRGQSPGKKITGLKVVRLDGKEGGFSDHLLRAVFQIVDILFSMGLVAVILITSSDKRQRFGDMAANTSVVRTRPDSYFSLHEILNIQTIEKYEPKFPAVRQLADQDMLIIKNAIQRYQRYPNEAHIEALNSLIEKICTTLEIPAPKSDKVEFLKTLIRDYIVLTR